MRLIVNSAGKKLLVTAMCILLSGCASANDPGYEVAGINDPLEGINRATFAVNDAVDQAVLEPVARGYRAVMPKPGITGIRNFLRNLRSPVNAANQILQGDVEGFARDVTRFGMNTTIGLGGLIDVAGQTGAEYEYEDFGQTLAVWGLDHGAYLVLPLLGPSSIRDAAGIAVDGYADPVRLYLFNTDQEVWHYARTGVGAVDKREELLDALDALRANSFDYYAALRSAYFQKRAALVRDNNTDDIPSASIPDYDDPEFDEEW